MGMIRGLLTGFTLAGACVVAYEQKIYSTSSYLRNAVTSLSKDLDALRIESRADEVHLSPVTLDKLPLGEQVKVQWNEQLLKGVHALYTTEWARLAGNTWTLAKNEAKAISDRLSS